MKDIRLAAILTTIAIAPICSAQYYPTYLSNTATTGAINNHGEVVLGSIPNSSGAGVWLPQANHSYPAGFTPLSVPSGWSGGGWLTSSTNDHLDVVGGAVPPNAPPGENSYVVAQFGDSFSAFSAGFNALHGPTTPIPLGINNLHQVIEAPDWGWGIWLPSAAYNLPAGFSIISWNGVASAINNSGQIVGGAYDSNPTLGYGNQAEIWLPSAAFGLPQGFNQIGPTGSFATALNDSGQAVIDLNFHTSSSTAAIWLPTADFGLSAGVHAIGPTNSKTIAINSQSQVIGTYSDNGATHGFLWDPVAGFQDLNDLINPADNLVIENVLGINDSSEILAIGTQSGTQSVFLLSLPEPTTLLLPMSLLLFRRRRSA